MRKDTLNLELKFILETHVHADHITGMSRIKKALPQVKSLASFAGGIPCVDIKAHDGDEIKIGDLLIKVMFTPGHTDGCLTFYCRSMIFTGDTLFIRGCGRTDFQGGNPENLYDSVTQKLFTLPDDTIVYPAHDYKGMLSSTIGEEKKFNLRLAGKTREEFVEIMNNLNLSLPKKIKESLPANMQCGKVS